MANVLCLLTLLLSFLRFEVGPAVLVTGSFGLGWQTETPSGRNIDYEAPNGPAKWTYDYHTGLMLSAGEQGLASVVTRLLIDTFVKSIATKNALPKNPSDLLPDMPPRRKDISNRTHTREFDQNSIR